MADSADLRTTPMVRSPFTDRPTLYLYDSVPGGAGFARRIYGQFAAIGEAARAHLAACPCEAGCPSCVGPFGESGGTAKRGAARLLIAFGADGPRV